MRCRRWSKGVNVALLMYLSRGFRVFLRMMIRLNGLFYCTRYSTTVSNDSDMHDDFKPANKLEGSGISLAHVIEQVEGAANEDGRKPSIWETFSYSGNGNMFADDEDVVCDQHHKYKEDFQLMANMGLEAYRFSILWSRIIPGIEAHITLYHWDLPQTLEYEYEGWVIRRVVYGSQP